MGGGQAEWATLLIKIFLDQTLFSALINILYASLNGILSNMSPQEAFARARQVLVPAMVSSWRFWPAVQLISYATRPICSLTLPTAFGHVAMPSSTHRAVWVTRGRYSPLIPVDFKLLWIDTMEILWVAYLSGATSTLPIISRSADHTLVPPMLPCFSLSAGLYPPTSRTSHP